MSNTLSFLVLVIGLATANLGLAQTFSSGQVKNTLIELYTSEGCSSCPPADTWLRDLKDHPALWDRLIPVGFHVDYWDWIGWKDQFAQASFGERQKHYRTKRKTRSVYTPGFFINGHEWRGFFETRASLPPLSDASVGVLTVKVSRQKIAINYRPTNPSKTNAPQLSAYVALLSFGKENTIKAGENNGRSLKHDFIVEALQTEPMQQDQSDYQLTVPSSFLSLKKPDSRYGLAVWIADQDNLDVIQATGGWLERK
ncbi:MAG: DUF1223 domain-containing protein [Pseudomonadales bacterium]|nr:DUF1223 domain-containing protein [Pseudomonadales bacterium]